MFVLLESLSGPVYILLLPAHYQAEVSNMIAHIPDGWPMDSIFYQKRSSVKCVRLASFLS